ncbi:MAG TPA: histidine phosphatase family protein [Rhizomicrobium sp.]|nr:histidine phosphatase family protein [Rhizomicrobium sp.]
MTAQRIVFIRHGKPQIVESVPSAQWRLSQEGKMASAALAPLLSDYTFKDIASSPEPKAVDTAAALAAPLGLGVETDPGFAEHARGSVGFIPLAQLEASIARFFASRDEIVFGDETADAAYARFAAALARQTAKGARDIMIVTHGTVLTLHLARTLGFDPFPFWKALATPAAIVLESGQIRILDAQTR